jgi:hypothetical protein
VVTAVNLGDADVDGGVTPVTVTDRVPAGLRVTGVEGFLEEEQSATDSERVPLTCSLSPLRCSYAGTLAPYRQLQMMIDVAAEQDASSGEVNEATVSGGGAPSASVSRGVPIGASAPFGLESYELAAESEGGGADTQAGSHPFQLTAAVALNQTDEPGKPPALAKDLRLELPAGLIDDSNAIPQCSSDDFSTSSEGVDLCPAETALGAASVTIDDPSDFGPEPVTLTVPVFNLVPAPGEPARFGVDVEDAQLVFDASVRTGTDYGVTLSASDIPETMTLIGATVTLWGVPGDSRHDSSRGWSCVDEERYDEIMRSLPSCTAEGEVHPRPLLTLPGSCAGLPKTSAAVDSWEDPGVFGSSSSTVPLPALSGCNLLPFGPSVQVAPDDQEANTPSGFTIQLRVSQETSLNPEGLAESGLRDATVALPTGMQLAPVTEAGPQCSTGEVGYTGVNATTGADEFTSAQPSCPQASKIATVKIDTPLLASHPLEGALYLASQTAPGPFENRPAPALAMYLLAEDPVSGVLVKLPTTLTQDPASGQFTLGLEDLPQLALEDVEIHFFGGEHATFLTPAYCGLYTTNASFTPWSGDAPTTASSSFEIDDGPNGSGPAGCPPPPQPGGTEANGGSGSTGQGTGSPTTTTPTAPARSLTATPLVTVTTAKLLATGGLAPVHIACSRAACQGSIELVIQIPATDRKDDTAGEHKQTLVLATGSFSLANGKHASVLLHLTPTGRKLLAHAKHHPLAAKLILSPKGGKTMTKAVLAG